MVIEFLNKENQSDCQFVEDLYVKAFPPYERRPISRMYNLYTKESAYKINTIKINDEIVGFITHWDFDDFVYAEHFSISDRYRNEGFGQRAINLFVDLLDNKPLILEVEHALNDLAERRIKFYQRQGFTLYDEIPYSQPPYVEDGEYIPLHLMSKGNINMNEKGDYVKKSIYKYVYNINL